MKTLKCDMCDVTADGETFDGWMKALMPHYMEAHPEVMSNPELEKDMDKWMTDNKARFDATN